MEYTYKDCYARLENGRFAIGNACIERTFELDGTGLAALTISDAGGTVWAREEGIRRLRPPFGCTRLEVRFYEDDHHALSERFLAAELIWHDDRGGRFIRTLSVFPQTPFVSMTMRAESIGIYHAEETAGLEGGNENAAAAARLAAQSDSIDVFPLPRGHYRLHVSAFYDKTDENDALLRTYTRQAYTSGWSGEWDEGNVFVLDDYVHDRALMAVKDAPFPASTLARTQKDFMIQRGECAYLVGSGLEGADTACALQGYGSTVGVGRREELDRLYRAYYKKVWKRTGGTRIMSNTWGDRHQDRAVCHEFMLREIDRAAFLGADIVQIDDGWQKGHTVNSALKKGGVWEGYYKADPDFWQVNREKFPQGLKPLLDRARGYGLEMGLWFSPDSTDNFAAWRRDADTILGLWKNEGVTHFKLDGVNIRSKAGEANYLRLLDAVTKESNGVIGLNQDFTAQIRLGSLYFKQYGNLFVENRYTDSASYYPHATLKNLWLLSRLIPPARLQFEVLNPRRNAERYIPGDEFAPNYYDMDYLFASVMLASPLLWMEMSYLGEEDSQRLKRIIALYRAHRDALASGDVSPIGEEPDGMSLTGFKVDCGQEGYLLLFRESTRRDTFTLPETLKGAQLELLSANAEIACSRDAVTFGKKRAYAFFKWIKEDK